MPPREGMPRPSTPLTDYLKGIQDRPGWSIARVARESGGRISKATLFRLMAGENKKGATIEIVRLVAQIVGDDPDAVLTRVAGSLVDEETQDPRLVGLDPNDPVVQHILDLDIDEEMRGFMLDRRRQQVAEQRERDLREIEREIEFWSNRRSGAA